MIEHFEHICNRIKNGPPFINGRQIFRFIIKINDIPSKCPICNSDLFNVTDIMVEDGFKALICKNLNHFFIQSYQRPNYFKQTKVLTNWPNEDNLISK